MAKLLLLTFLLKCWRSQRQERGHGLDTVMEFTESDAEKLDLLESIARFDAILSR
jgi:hypothetical protein